MKRYKKVGWFVFLALFCVAAAVLAVFLAMHYSICISVVVMSACGICWLLWDWIRGFFRWIGELLSDLF